MLPAVCCHSEQAAIGCRRLHSKADVGTTFVVERQHLHAVFPLQPTSAEGGVEEEGGREKLPVRAAETLKQQKLWLRLKKE